jgi:hypothetical protein
VRARTTDGGACSPIAIPVMMATVPMLTTTMGMMCGLFNGYSSFLELPAVSADGINSVSQPGDWIVGSLRLSNGETVWLQARQAGISADERKGIASVEREYRGSR